MIARSSIAHQRRRFGLAWPMPRKRHSLNRKTGISRLTGSLPKTGLSADNCAVRNCDCQNQPANHHQHFQWIAMIHAFCTYPIFVQNTTKNKNVTSKIVVRVSYCAIYGRNQCSGTLPPLLPHLKMPPL